MEMRGSYLLIVLLLGVTFAHSKVTQGTVSGNDFIYISKFCFDKVETHAKHVPKLTVEVSNADGSSTSGQAVYLFDDQEESWPKQVRAKSCSEKVKYSRRIVSNHSEIQGILVPPTGDAHETVNVTEHIRPRWWYVVVAHCGGKVDAKYKITFVQADGSQFGFDTKGIFGLYIFFFCLYTVGFGLYMLNLYFQVKTTHTLVQRFAGLYGNMVFGVLLIIIHLASYNASGKGVTFLYVVGTIAEEASVLGLMVVCLWVASGCNKSMKEGGLFLPVTIGYTVLSVIMLIYYHATKSSSWSTNFIYDQWPGILLMIFRLIVALLFSAMLRSTYLLNKAADKQVFYKWFGIIVGVWMAAVPLIVFCCEAIVSYWQVRVTQGLILILNGVVFAMLSILMRPTRMAAMFPPASHFQESFLTGVPDLGSYVPPADPHMI